MKSVTLDISNRDLYNDYMLDNNMFDCKSRYILCFGGRGGGKSQGFIQKAIKNVMSSNYCRVVLVRKVYATVANSILKELITQISDWGLTPFFDINTRPPLIRYKPNGNEIITTGLDKAEKTKGLKDPTIMIIDEADQITEDDLRQLSGSLRTQKAEYLQIILIFNTSKGKEQFLYKRFLQGRDYKQGVRYDYDNVTLLHVNHNNNQFNSLEFHREMKALKDINYTAYQEDTLGMFLDGNDSNALFLREAVSNMPYNSWITPTGNTDNRYLAADIATHGNDNFIIVVRDGWCIIDIVIHSKIDGDDVIREIKRVARKHKIKRSNIIFDANGVGDLAKGFLQGTMAFKGNASPIQPKKQYAQRYNYKNLRHQTFYKLAELVNNHEIYVNKELQSETIAVKSGQLLSINECLVQEMRATLRDANALKVSIISKQDIKAQIKRSPDLLDCFAMLATFDLCPQNELSKHLGIRRVGVSYEA